ncbi:DUF502 domain-containing protein [PVC group bacterium]|nr:DUF502 domain-containing protein [PVC group bacterium]
MKEKPKFWKRVFQGIKKNIITGIIVLIPFGATIIVVKFIFNFLNGLSPIIHQYVNIPIPGIGVIVMLILLGLAGMITRNVIGKSFLSYFERMIYRAPIVGTIYRSSKQLMGTFSPEDTITYKKVVLIEYPHPGLRVVAFVTGSSEDSKGNKYYQVFVPTTPNPTSGMMEIVPQEKVILTNWSVEEAVKMVVSGGILVPEKKFDE